MEQTTHILEEWQCSDNVKKQRLVECLRGPAADIVRFEKTGNSSATFKSNQIKSLLLSHHHSTSALVSEILMSVLQTVQKNNNNHLHMDRQCKKTTNNLHMDRQCKKQQQTIYIWTDSAKKTHNNHLHMDRQCKKTTNNLHMDRQCKKKQQTIYIWTDSAKKLHWSIYSAPDSAKQQQQFTYGQYIFTDCTEDNVQNTHTYTQYT